MVGGRGGSESGWVVGGHYSGAIYRPTPQSGGTLPSNYTHQYTIPTFTHDGDNEIVINQPENSSNMTTGELQNNGGSVKGNKYCHSNDLKLLMSLGRGKISN